MSRAFINQRVKELPYSGIRKFFDVAAEMKDVISLGVGEPDFFTPWNVREEGIYSLERRRTVYTSNAGLPELRAAVSEYIQNLCGLSYDPKNQVIVTVGVSEAIDIAMRAVLEPGDEVLVIEPCYVSYRACVLLAGGVPVPVPARAENDFRVTYEDIAPRVTDRTKAVIFCYPNNPTGAILQRQELEAIADVLRQRDILVISDEIYAELTYEQEPHISIASLPGMLERTIVLNGFSKSFAMTGWRLGYACGPAEIIAAMTKIHQYVIMCAATTAQYAGLEALRSGKPGVQAMRKEYDARRRFLLEELRKMGVDCFEARGAFYVFPSVAKFGMSSEEFCTKLLHERRLAIVPGTAFGDCGEGYVRCSYAYSSESIKEALSRLRAFISYIS
jgi:aminotransferase